MARNKVTKVKANGEGDAEGGVVNEGSTTNDPVGDQIIESEIGGSSGEDPAHQDPPLVEMAPVIAIEFDAADSKLPVDRYEVVQTCNATMPNGHRTTLKAGKVLDGRTYNLDALRSQGVRLAKID